MGHRRGASTRIAQALLALLNNGSAPYWAETGDSGWGSTVTFSRGALPELNKQDLATAKGVIIPAAIEGSEYDRGANEYFDITISVGISKNVGVQAQGREGEIDDLVSLVEQVQDFISWDSQQILTLPAVVDGSMVEIQPAHTARLILPFSNNPIFDSQLLRAEGVFLSVTNFTYHFETIRG
jgi:hypothetical protein